MTNKNGFSLVELLISMAMASIVMAAMFLTYEAQVRGKIGQEVALDMQQGARTGLEIMSADIRMAGCNPSATAGAGIVAANQSELRFTMDITGGGGSGNESNGAIDSLDEDVRYALSAPVNGDLIRERFLNGVSVEGEQPLVSNVDGLDFVYLDENGNITSNLTAIRSIEVSFVVRSGDTIRGMMRTYSDKRNYVNQQGRLIYRANDNFRRLQLTTTVQCRNLGR